MIYVKQNDRRPAAEATITKGGAAISLVGIISVTFKMRLDGGTGSLKVDAAATVTDAANGEVEYRWAVGDTDTPGFYLAEWEVLWGDGTPETFPTIGHDYVLIEGELG